MSRISLIALQNPKQEKQKARELMAMGYDARLRLKDAGLDGILHSARPQELDRLVKNGRDLSFEDAFRGMCFALAATNRQFFEICWGADRDSSHALREQALAVGTSFMQLMSVKEAVRNLTSAEIAGMTAAVLADTVFRFDVPRVIETCGMGGDRGFGAGIAAVTKTINASTLSALVLSSLGLPTIKHGSYANTSAVGSTDVVERFGARTSMTSAAEVRRIWSESGFCFFDAHWCRTIHDLSHLLMMETINHVVGPMAAPVSSETLVNKVMGVNHKVHPASVAHAYAVLHLRGIQKVGSVVVLGGLDEGGYRIDHRDEEAFREHCILDEVSPFTTLCSVIHDGHFRGTFMLSPNDFGISLDPQKIKLPNRSDVVQRGNISALRGEREELGKYLAMNASIGLFAERYVGVKKDAFVGRRFNREYLKECYRECLGAIADGRAWRKLERYVEATGGTISLCDN
ncbi:MAG: hypothetical protein AAB915_01105 [Patescibacteria group bacterium]